jgi:hypothetical protein
MDRTWPTELVAGSLAGHEADQVQDFSQGDPGPDFGEGDARHGGSQDAEDTSASRPVMSGETPGEQRRGTRNLLMQL